MTQEQANRILAEFEGWVVATQFDKKFIIDNDNHIHELKYTTDWNEFHRVWMNRPKMNQIDHDYVVNSIANESTPFYAATRLAQIITDKK